MLSNHLFWLAVALLSWSGFCVNTSAANFNGTKQTFKPIIQWLGMLGAIAGLIRAIMLSLHFNWWWFLGIVIGFFVVIGFLSAMFRGITAIVISFAGIIGIPVLWWFGGMF